MSTQSVWSPTIRILHWIIAVLTPVLFFSGEAEQEEIHMILGPILLMAILVRVWIGFTGKPHERFSSFFFGPGSMIRYIKQMLSGHAPRTAGHNPMAGPVMFMIIFLLFINSIMGEFLRAADKHEGPLASFLKDSPSAIVDPISILHSSFAHIVMFFVLVHFAGLITHTILHRENIARAMVTGEKVVDEEN